MACHLGIISMIMICYYDLSIEFPLKTQISNHSHKQHCGYSSRRMEWLVKLVEVVKFEWWCGWRRVILQLFLDCEITLIIPDVGSQWLVWAANVGKKSRHPCLSGCKLPKCPHQARRIWPRNTVHINHSTVLQSSKIFSRERFSNPYHTCPKRFRCHQIPVK